MLEGQALGPLIGNLPSDQESVDGGQDVTTRGEMDLASQGQKDGIGFSLLDPTLGPRNGPCCSNILGPKGMHSSEVLGCRQMLSGLKQVIRVQLVWLG